MHEYSYEIYRYLHLTFASNSMYHCFHTSHKSLVYLRAHINCLIYVILIFNFHIFTSCFQCIFISFLIYVCRIRCTFSRLSLFYSTFVVIFSFFYLCYFSPAFYLQIFLLVIHPVPDVWRDFFLSFCFRKRVCLFYFSLFYYRSPRDSFFLFEIIDCTLHSSTITSLFSLSTSVFYYFYRLPLPYTVFSVSWYLLQQNDQRF